MGLASPGPMKVRKRLVSGLAIILFGGSMSACMTKGRGEVVYFADVDPPPPRTAVVEARPGYVWIEGYWFRDRNQWTWIDGRYEAERPSHRYQQGRWHKADNRWLWNPGRWQSVAAPSAVRE